MSAFTALDTRVERKYLFSGGTVWEKWRWIEYEDKDKKGRVGETWLLSVSSLNNAPRAFFFSSNWKMVGTKADYSCLPFYTDQLPSSIRRSILGDATAFCRVGKHTLIYKLYQGHYLKVNSKESDQNLWCIFGVWAEKKCSSGNQDSVTNESGSGQDRQMSECITSGPSRVSLFSKQVIV